MRRWLPLLLKILVGGGLLAFLLIRIGLPEILGALHRVRLTMLPAAVAGLFATHLLHALALWLVTQGTQVSFWQIFLMGLRAWVWGMVTPARVGELSLIYYLRTHGLRAGEAGALVVLDRLTVLLLIGMITIGGAAALEVEVPLLVLLMVLLLLAAGIVSLATWQGLINAVEARLPHRLRAPWVLLSATLNQLLYQRPWSLLGFLLTQLVRLIVQYWITDLLFTAAGRPVPFVDVCLISSVARLAAIVPVSVNGLGVREGIMIVLFDKITGVDPVTIMAVAIWLNVLLYVSALLTYILLPARRPGAGTNSAAMASQELTEER